MFLAYADDCGTCDKKDPLQLMTAIILADKDFLGFELLLSSAIEALVPEEKYDEFTEFHAAELYGGYGIFAGVDQERRFKVINHLLTVIAKREVPVISGIVNKDKLAKQLYSSANPLDICFRMCVQGIDDYCKTFEPEHEFALLIVDNTSDKEAKKTLRGSFRQLRQQCRPPKHGMGQVWHLHDDMYFGDSRDSIGIQLADLCGYFIRKHERAGGDAAAEGFYNTIKDRIVFQKVEPE